MELATGHAPYANFSLTNIIIMTMHSPVPELERTFSDVSLLFPFCDCFDVAFSPSCTLVSKPASLALFPCPLPRPRS